MDIRRPILQGAARATHFPRASSMHDSVAHDKRSSPYPTNPAQRMLSHSRSLTFAKPDRRMDAGGHTPSPLIDDQHKSFHQPSQLYQSSVYESPAPAPSFSRPYNLYPTPVNPSLSGWGPGSDTSFIRSTFSSSNNNNNNSPSSAHNRSASAGSQQEQQGHQINPGGPMPHFWSDPFTDSTILASSYYGLPVMDRQAQIAIDQNLPAGFGQADFAPFEGINF